MANRSAGILYKYRFFIIAFAILILMVAAAIFLILRSRPQPNPEAQTIPISASASTSNISTSEDSPDETRLLVGLSEGQPQPQTFQPPPLVESEPLNPQEVQAILDRLPGMTVESALQQDFRIAQQPIPPPRTGETISESFPPPQNSGQPAPVESGPLEVLRYAPQGEIPTAPFVSLTFNQPMVALNTLDALSEDQVPVQIQPSLPGTWRWLGTRTLTFEYDSELIDRLPKATEYRVSVPAGTRSVAGGVLAQPVEWTFSTPPPKVTTTYPYNEPQPLEPLFFISFDQRIDPAAVLNTIQVKAGNQTVALALASEAEIQADERVKNLVKSSPEGRWLAFRAVQALPTDTVVTISIGPGTPSAEGPLVTQEQQSYSFSTYAPLRILEHGCAWYGDPCRPLTPFFIRFNNPIDAQVYQENMLRIEPQLPGAAVDIFGDTIHIKGATQGQTTYTVWVSGDLQDIFGQKLGTDTSLIFKVGPADPLLVGPDQPFVTIDPAAKKPVLSVYTINYNKLDVKIYAVQPSDWPGFKRYLQEYSRTDKPLEVPGNLVWDKTLPVEAPADTLTEVGIDLSPVMDGSFGQFIVIVKPPTGLFQPQEEYWRTIQVWVQVTQIGLDAFVDHSEMVIWTTNLLDGTPLSDVTITPGPTGIETATRQDGTARFSIPEGTSYLVAAQGADRALLPNSIYAWDESSWQPRSPTDELRWYVFDDRQMYRPGEEIHVKGWLRRVGGKQDGDVGLVGTAVDAVSYRITDPQGNDLGNGRVEVSALGGFDFAFTLPEATNLGYAQIYLGASGNLNELSGLNYIHSFQIQEFRRPEFEVTTRNESPAPYFAGEKAVVAVGASYYAGGPLPNAEVTWLVTSSPSNYSPPNWPDFIFGTWEPWWWFYEPGYGFDFFGGSGESTSETFSGVTDAAGEHYLQLDFDSGKTRPYSIQAEATVMDVNRQAWTDATTLLVHPANLYIGLRSQSLFVDRGTPLKVDFIVTDLDGNPIPDRPVEIRAARLEWKYRGSDWSEEEADVQTCSAGSQNEPVTCTFDTPLGGTYRITAIVSDEKGRQNQSQFTRWVSGGKQPPARKVEQETVTLIPDKESYQPGDVAEILVQSPFSPAEGLLTVSRSGILYTQRFQLDENGITLQVPIEAAHIPNLNIQVDLVGAAPRSDDQGEPLAGVPPRPAYASAQLVLNIPPLQRTLSVQLSPEVRELEPGGQTTVGVNLQDADGNPVSGAELSLVVVDEAVLALSGYQLADPLAVFYTTRPPDLASFYSRAGILLVDPLALAQGAGSREALATQVVEKVLEGEVEMPAMAPAPAEDQAAAEANPIRMRTDFNPLAAFVPIAQTDANGAATLMVKLPDNLTRYRVMVVAVDSSGKLFGSAETNLTARLPLMVRPSAPRFLNFGDHFELPVVLQNQTDQPLVVDVAVRAANLELTSATGLRVTVPPRDRVEVRFPAAANLAGTAQIQVAAVSGSFADAASVELPVYTPATTEAFATYGIVDQGTIVQPIANPEGVFPQFGGLEINTSSTALQALTDAVLYLVSYPYECSEQLASRLLAVAALRDVLTAFQADGLPSPQAMEAAVERDIQVLQGLQNSDGGFPYWRRGQDSIPFNTIHVAHALQRAALKGFNVPADMLASATDYLQQIENYYPSWYRQETRWTLSAYALYVRNLMGDSDPNKAVRLLEDASLEKLSMEAIGWLWPVLQDSRGAQDQLEAIRSFVNNRIVETAGAANFTTQYSDQTYLLLSSDRRTDAILLEAMIGDNPQHDLIPKLVNGLLAHTTRGRWGSTQENVFVLLALDRYFNTYEAQTPDFIARIWLGETYAGEHAYQGRTTERHETLVPMSYLVTDTLDGEAQNLILSKEGSGRLYYRLGLRYAPTDLNMGPLDMGFTVQRIYEAVDDPQDVTQDENGTWHIRAGARVRVRLTMVADNRRYHVALVDPLPAGLEIINPGLAVSGSVPQDPNNPDYRYGWWWWSTWYEHQNLRDERAEAFTSLLWDGVYQYSYVARATTPGTFVAPPTKAEEMYSPEVFGRSGSDLVIIE